MRIHHQAARKAGVRKDPAIGYLKEELGKLAGFVPALRVRVEGKSTKVVVTVSGLIASVDDSTGFGRSAAYAYWVEMSISELAFVVREAMKVAPSAELLEAVTTGAVAALPRRSRRRKK